MRKFIFGSDYIYLYELDLVLKFFKTSDFISNHIFYGNNPPPDFDNVVRQLETDGMISIDKHGVRITLKGKMKVRRGGYRIDAMKKRIAFAGIIIGCIASIISIFLLIF